MAYGMNSPLAAPADSLVISYLFLRKAVGILGIALPFVLAFGGMLLAGPALEPSVSAYYYTGMRNIFVGTLCAIAVFMLSYRGYERKDDVAGDIACAFALGVAFLPTTPEGSRLHLQRLIGGIHLMAAAGLFLTLSYFSLCLFTKTGQTTQPTPKKLQRNKVYRICGYIMLTAIALMVLHGMLPAGVKESLRALHPVFWLESVAVVAFGMSWLTKGEALLKDES